MFFEAWEETALKTLALNSIAFGVLALTLPNPLAASSTYTYAGPLDTNCLGAYEKLDPENPNAQECNAAIFITITLHMDLSLSQLANLSAGPPPGNLTNSVTSWEFSDSSDGSLGAVDFQGTSPLDLYVNFSTDSNGLPTYWNASFNGAIDGVNYTVCTDSLTPNNACTSGAKNFTTISQYANPSVSDAQGWNFSPGTWSLSAGDGTPEPSGVVLTAAALALILWRRRPGL